MKGALSPINYYPFAQPSSTNLQISHVTFSIHALHATWHPIRQDRKFPAPPLGIFTDCHKQGYAVKSFYIFLQDDLIKMLNLS